MLFLTAYYFNRYVTCRSLFIFGTISDWNRSGCLVFTKNFAAEERFWRCAWVNTAHTCLKSYSCCTSFRCFVLCVDFGTPLPPISVKGSIHHVFVHFTAGLIFHLCLSFMIEVQWKIVITSGLIYSCISFYWTKSNEPFKVLIVFFNIAVLVISIVLDSYDVIKISSYY